MFLSVLKFRPHRYRLNKMKQLTFFPPNHWKFILNSFYKNFQNDVILEQMF